MMNNIYFYCFGLQNVDEKDVKIIRALAMPGFVAATSNVISIEACHR